MNKIFLTIALLILLISCKAYTDVKVDCFMCQWQYGIKIIVDEKDYIDYGKSGLKTFTVETKKNYFSCENTVFLMNGLGSWVVEKSFCLTAGEDKEINIY